MVKAATDQARESFTCRLLHFSVFEVVMEDLEQSDALVDVSSEVHNPLQNLGRLAVTDRGKERVAFQECKLSVDAPEGASFDAADGRQELAQVLVGVAPDVRCDAASDVILRSGQGEVADPAP